MENVNIKLLLRDRAGKSLDKEFEKITKPIVKLHNDFTAKMSSDPKFLGEEHVSSIIKVIEGYAQNKPGAVRNTLIPLPPLAEQKRIIARLEELLPLCERLK